MNYLIIALCIFSLSFNVLANTAPNDSIKIIDKYYDIEGRTADELRAAMNMKRPNIDKHPYDAVTLWHIDWSYKTTNLPISGFCKLYDVAVKTTITKMYPRWIHQGSDTEKLRIKWENYRFILVEIHEKEHVQNGIAAGNEIERMLISIPAVIASCSEIIKIANREANRIIKQHADWDDQYDKDTHHGITQGAVFP